MSARIPPVDPNMASAEVLELLERARLVAGDAPNLHAAMAVAPAALRGHVAFRAALAGGRLSPVLAEQIALLVSEENGSRYCVATTARACARSGVPPPELRANQRGRSSDARVAAALRFAAAVLDSRGRVLDGELTRVHEAGFDDEEIEEIVAHVALTCFANFFAQVACPELDVPRVPLTTDRDEV